MWPIHFSSPLSFVESGFSDGFAGFSDGFTGFSDGFALFGCAGSWGQAEPHSPDWPRPLPPPPQGLLRFSTPTRPFRRLPFSVLTACAHANCVSALQGKTGRLNAPRGPNFSHQLPFDGQ